MPTMTKRVNVRATVAVRNTNPPIYGTYKNIIMTTGDILKCLTKRATVDEILPDGSTIRLNYKNYYTDNGAGLDAKGEINIIKPKQPPVKKAAPKEPEKTVSDIVFSSAPMSNVDTKDNEESENSATETDMTTDNTVTEPPTILVTEGSSKDEITATGITETAVVGETGSNESETENAVNTTSDTTQVEQEEGKELSATSDKEKTANTENDSANNTDNETGSAATVEQTATVDKAPAKTKNVNKKNTSSSKKKK